MQKLLVVDDDIVALKATSRILQASGYDVTSTTRTDEALHFLERDKFKGVVCDHHMPDQNGSVIVSAVQHHHPETKVLLVTGYREDLRSFSGRANTPCAWSTSLSPCRGFFQAVHEEIGLPASPASCKAVARRKPEPTSLHRIRPASSLCRFLCNPPSPPPASAKAPARDRTPPARLNPTTEQPMELVPSQRRSLHHNFRTVLANFCVAPDVKHCEDQPLFLSFHLSAPHDTRVISPHGCQTRQRLIYVFGYAAVSLAFAFGPLLAVYLLAPRTLRQTVGKSGQAIEVRHGALRRRLDPLQRGVLPGLN